ncbi:ABC transporter substrate-binding protein [Nocardiopsis rhodophaea]|uniref:ABC transporter substrate-binding protein n=1 Tax=Nocardiopsis rhodophaea TaxID=280238 RepID=A0ABN2S3T6_9ACTN
MPKLPHPFTASFPVFPPFARHLSARGTASTSSATAAAAAASALVVALTGCGSGASDATDDPTTASPEGFPVTIANCGTDVAIDAPPERVVTMNQHATEVMLALGLEDRLVGTAYLDDAVLPEFQEAYDAVPVLAEEYPSFEQVLAADPDFVYAGFGSSAFDDAEGRGREALADAGIATYENIEQCTDHVTMETVSTEIDNVASIFGVEDRADEVNDDITSRVDEAHERLSDVDPVDVVVVDSIDSTVFTAGGNGIGNEIIKRAGGRNVFDDVDKVFADVSVEQVAERSPDAILIYDYGATPVEEKKRALLDNPTLAEVPAIKEERFAVLPLSSAVVGVRAGDAVYDVAQQLHPDAF